MSSKTDKRAYHSDSFSNIACVFVQWLKHYKLTGWAVSKMAYKQRCLAKVENVEVVDQVSLLDLPELTLECILGRLPLAGLCDVAGVCLSLRYRCQSDHLWEGGGSRLEGERKKRCVGVVKGSKTRDALEPTK